MESMEPTTNYMTASQVARHLGISSERVRQLARSGVLKPDLVIDHCRYWTPETIVLFASTRGPWGRFRNIPRPTSAEPNEVQQ